MAAELPINVVTTIQSVRALSTRGLYAMKWHMFEDCCRRKSFSQYQCLIARILTFLQELLEGGRSYSTLKVYLAAISVYHVGINGAAPSIQPLPIWFLKGAHCLRPVT